MRTRNAYASMKEMAQYYPILSLSPCFLPSCPLSRSIATAREFCKHESYGYRTHTVRLYLANENVDDNDNVDQAVKYIDKRFRKSWSTFHDQ